MIPKEFQTFGQTVKIEWVENLVNQDDIIAQMVYREGKMRCQTPTESYPIPQERLELAYWEEVFGLVFYELGDYRIGEERLRTHQVLQGWMANTFHQIIKTSTPRVLIPEQFQIFGQTIKIKFIPTLKHTEEIIGEMNYRKNEIRIQESTSTICRPQTQLERTYLHEVMHLIFNELGDFTINDKILRDDECLINLLGNMLHQILKTSVYEVEA